MTPDAAGEIRGFDPGNELAVLDLWNRTLGSQFPISRRLFHQQTSGDPNFRPTDAAVAWAGGEPVGFALAKPHRQIFPTGERYAGTGALSVLLVRPDWRGRGIGGRLLAWAEQHLLDEGAKRVRLGAGLEHTFPGVPTTQPTARDFLQRHGYSFPYLVSDLLQDLRTYRRPSQVTTTMETAGGEGSFGPCQPGEEQALLDFVAATFPGGWWYWTRKRLEAGDRALLYLLRQGGRVAGFAHTYTSASRVIGPPIFWSRRLGPHYGGLGPMGLESGLRGRGLGLALLCKALEHLRAQGVRRMVIDWTDLPDFYARAGFQVWQSYWMSGVKNL